jgi:hypothetical protein
VAAAHVVTCEGVRRERAAAAAAVSPERVWRSVGRSLPLARLLRAAGRSFSACCFGAAVPANELVSSSEPSVALQPPRTGRRSSRSIAVPSPPPRGLSAGPVPARFLRHPVEAPEMNFSISSEMNQVIRAGCTELGAGGREVWCEVGSGGRVSGEEAPGFRCRPWEEQPAPRGPAPRALPWLPGRVGDRG